MENADEHKVNNNESGSPEFDTPNGKNDWLKVPFAFIDFEKATTVAKSITNRFEQLETIVFTSVEECKKNTDRLEKYFKIAGDCQKQTAAFANNQLEKHALHPAIETVDALTRLIQQIYEQMTNLSAPQTQCPLFSTLISSVTQASQIAKEKCQSLDIGPIEPKPCDDFEPDKHEIKNVVNTNDREMHKKINDLLTPGLIYRGTVLRQAKVSVFRYCENS